MDYTLYGFAYCSDESMNKVLQYIANIAEPEIWTSKAEENSKPLNILKNYIFHKFEQCYKQGKVLYSEDNRYACFNTGLLTVNGKDIIIIFGENMLPDNFTAFANNNYRQWKLKYATSRVDREFMELFDRTPELATYTDNYYDMIFNPELPLEVNTDHILDDNWNRIQTVIPYPKNVARTLLLGVVEEAIMRAKRNHMLVVPMYYNDTITFLLPIKFPVDEDKYVTMALALEKTSKDQYRANTIFTSDIAYEKARLIMKPEPNWLLENF